MKNAIIGICSLLILLLAGAAISTAEGRTMRENEISSTMSTAMKKSMEILTLDKDYEINDEKEFVADFIQNAMVKMNSNSTYEVEIYTVDTSLGILDAEVTEHYEQFFRPGRVSVRRTVVLDDYSDKSEFFAVTFKDGENIIKQINVHGGDFMSKALLPKNSGFTKWKLVENNNIYTEADINNVAVVKNLDFIGVK